MGDVLRLPGVRSLFAANCLGRLPMGALGLLLILQPVGACMRSLWPELAPDPGLRHAAYSLEGVAMEAIYIAGPVVIVGGIGAWSLTAALLRPAVTV